MSLLSEPWLPVRTRSGVRRWISPVELSDPEVLAFDADRADFNGALAQFAIGLLTTFAPLANERDWSQWFRAPPSRDTLQTWLESGSPYFEYTGNGARFMQDRVLDVNPEFDVAGLLIDSPGENTIKKNSDHFVKRRRVERLCPHCAMTALFTLQVNAPAGGAGQRTGLRGGGPLTTLLSCEPTKSLWHDLWLNVTAPPERNLHGGDLKKTAAHFTFPWAEPIECLQKPNGQVSPVQVHPMHIYWAMPRRIRLDLDHVTAGTCDVCHRPHEGLVSHYATVPNGLSYKGPWDHTLSPYYQLKDEWLPLHPQPSGFGYRYWLPWLVGVADDKATQRPARVITQFHGASRTRQTGVGTSLWAFGYDMEKMKARCWYEARLPVYSLHECGAAQMKRLQHTLQSWLAGARDSANALRHAVKTAWFATEARGTFSAVDAAFWSQTERPFYLELQKLIEAIRADAGDDALMPLTEHWLKTMQQACQDLFEHVFVGAGQIDRSNPRRVAMAHKGLQNALYGHKLRQTLRLPMPSAKSTENHTATKKT